GNLIFIVAIRRKKMDLDIDVVEKQDKTIVRLSGEIDVYTAPELKDILLPLVEKENNNIEVCFSDVEYMDSTGLGIFINALKSSKTYNSHMELVNLTDRVLRLFTITGLDEIIDINPESRGVEDSWNHLTL